MDFAFVPCIGDSRPEHLSDLLQRIPNTIVALTPQPTGLSDFFSVVDQVIQNNGAGSASNLLIGAHGDEEGQLFLALDSNTASPATYEKIKNSTTIAIPSGVKDALTFVRLKSCLLGTDATQPLLVALREALGNPTLVTSPRYIHATFGPYFSGLWEFMLYQFAILGDDLGKNPLKTRDAPRSEYQATAPYPVYQRYQHKTLRDFADGWNWAVKDSPGTNLKYSLQYIGTRYRYRLEIPIIKPGTTDELIFNYYPDSGTPVVNFTETNDPFHLFGGA